MKVPISIITPSYNQGRYIERTIRSVLDQGIAGMEYLVIDGGSNDETVPILRDFGDRVSWVSESDAGHSDAINKGIRRSTGAIIGWLNSDDVYYPGALQNVLEYFEEHPDVEVVYGDANHIDEHDQFIEKYPTETWDWNRLIETCFISQPATFLRRSVVDRCGLLDVTLRQSMDYEYWIRLGKAGVRFAYLPRLLAATRLHDESFTVGSRVACHRAVNVLMRRHFGRVPDRWIFNYAHAVVETKGIQRDHALSFAIAISAVSWYAAVRWNHGINGAIWKTTGSWLWGNLRRSMHGRPA
ncbi:MAG TPA: glycosyltransferase family 2 protein [Verrucomicrobiae bacterium]|nr:glycosyltransferase family 2 protein [Verrucomicrobiae bacterium]